MIDRFPRAALACAFALTLTACGGGDPDTDEAAPPAEAEAEIEQGGEAAQPAPDASAGTTAPVTVADIDSWQKGMVAELEAVRAAGTKLKEAKTGDDTLSAMMGMQEMATWEAGAKAAGLDVERYKFIKSELSAAVSYLTPALGGIDTTMLSPAQRDELRKSNAAQLKQMEERVPPDVVEVLKPRAAELRKQSLELVGGAVEERRGVDVGGRIAIVMGGLLAAIACTSEESKPLFSGSAGGHVPVDTPPGDTARAAPLPARARLGKPAAELQAEGWTAVEPPSELLARLRDTAGISALAAPALERHLDSLAPAGSFRPFDSLGGFADTIRMAESEVLRMVRERVAEVEAAVVDSLRQVMELGAVPRGPKLGMQTGDLPVRPSAWPAPAETRPLQVIPAAFGRSTPVRTILQQGGQTQAIQLGPNLQGTQTIGADGSISTEVGGKYAGTRGTAEVSMQGEAMTPEQFNASGEVGSSNDMSSTKRGTIDGNTVEETRKVGWEERLAYCPDAAGIVRGRVKRWNRQSTSGTVKGVKVEMRIVVEADFALTAQVDDHARVTDLLVEGHATVDVQGGQRGGGNSTPFIRTGRGEGRAQGVEPADGSSTGSWYLRIPPGPAFRLTQTGVIEEMVNAIAAGRTLARQAEQRWRNGACVEVIATPEAKPLHYGQSTAIRAEVRHKRERNESFPYPVRPMAKKWGEDPTQASITLGRISPSGVTTAPASFHYTAPSKGTEAAQQWRNSFPPQDDLYFGSVSRRGIGTDHVRIPLDSLRQDGYAIRYTERQASALGEIRNVTFTAIIHPLAQPDSEGNTHAGWGRYEGRIVTQKANCRNNLPLDRETILLGGSARATASASSSGDGETFLVFVLTPLDPPKLHLMTRSFRGVEAAAGTRPEDLPDALIPVLGNLTLTGGTARDGMQREMPGGSCHQTIKMATEWDAARIQPVPKPEGERPERTGS